MFCPNCGQQLTAGSTKYCPRCGTQLAGLAEWLAGGAALLPSVAPAAPAKATRSPRRKGMRRGAKVMFLAGMLLPFMIAMSIAAESPGPLILALIIFFVGFTMTLYARLFADDLPPAMAGSPARPQMPGVNPAALPPAAAPDTRANNFGWRGVRTAELAQPPSVTENTTRLLDDE